MPIIPPTEGIKYAGSKLKLIPNILAMAKQVNARRVFDGFAGTTRVSQALAQSGYDVVCNDIAEWTEVFAVCYLLARKTPEEYAGLIAHLNALPPRDGWFTQHYGGDPRAQIKAQTKAKPEAQPKRPWQIQNTRKLDAIREEIERLALTKEARCVALTSLILALDQVDSTLGHYAAYLREWSPRSYHPLQLRVPRILSGDGRHEVHRADIFDLLPRVQADLSYYDPPYGSNNEKMPPSRVRYAAYYHLWTSICKFDHPDLFGRVNRRADTSDGLAASVFEEFRRDGHGEFLAVKAIRRLLEESATPHVILSYSSGGRATAHELHEAITASGRLLQTLEIDYRKNVMAGMKWTNEWLRAADTPNREFLFLIERR
ncbi:MAG TPA: DNA adenine methylase [Candidatus Saccharimonadales bacterium]|jgi:adenine-specific DNA-methyltransferase|nr:DNA adenine methylase [Candidatus Saccharimonadales bacterium]